MSQKLNITKAISRNTKKDGTPLVGKYGPYFLTSIQATQYGQQWITGFTKTDVKIWEGKEMELEIKEELYNGQKQLKFEVPKKSAGGIDDESKKNISAMGFKLGAMDLKLDSIIEHLSGRSPLNLTSDGRQMPNFNVPKNYARVENGVPKQVVNNSIPTENIEYNTQETMVDNSPIDESAADEFNNLDELPM